MAAISFFLVISCFGADYHSLRPKAIHSFDFLNRFKRALRIDDPQDFYEGMLENIRLRHYLKNSEFAEYFVPFLISETSQGGIRSALAANFLESISTIGQYAPIFSKLASSEPGKSDGQTVHSRTIAIGLLGHIRSKSDLPRLAKIASVDEKIYLRESAIRALGNYGKDASGYIPLLRGMLKDKEPFIRYYAANSLWKISHRADWSLKVIEELLFDDTSSFRKNHSESIVRSYCEVARFSPTAKPTLLKLLQSESRLTQLLAADAILYLDSQSETALTRIESLFSPPSKEDQYSEREIRLQAASILSRFKSKKEVVFEFFVNQMKKQNSSFNLYSLLKWIHSSHLDPKEKLVLYIQGLQKPVPVARQISAEFLAEMKEDALDSIPLLAKQLKNETDFLARYQIERSLSSLSKYHRSKQ
jgi:HEAT repeat protein